MRRKHLILASCIISALLLTFTFHVSADENVTADAGASSNSAPLLDSYFWENYDLLPYIESTELQQYIDTGVKASNNLICDLRFSDVSGGSYIGLFGNQTDPALRCFISTSNNSTIINFNVSNQAFSYTYRPYSITHIQFENNKFYLNEELIKTFTDDEFESSDNIYIFALGPNYSPGNYKLYSFYIYDVTLNDGAGDYVRYYYPAKSKSGDVIGLYDAVSKTFVTTSGNVPFASPTDDKVIHFQIGDFISNGLGWIGDILEFAIEEPVILMFMAIGLCGVAFRWARRVVHF